MKPEMFARIVDQFGGRLPLSDEPIRAFLIRQEGFSTAGANELIKTLRETMSGLPDGVAQAAENVPVDKGDELEEGGESPTKPQPIPPEPAGPAPGTELITLPLGQNAKAELRLIGDISAISYARLIRHLELLRDMAAEGDE